MDHGASSPASSTTLDARMRRSRAALFEALLTLLERKPIDQITIREITREAGVGYATFFRHYPAKDALLDDVATSQIAELLSLSVPVLLDTDSRTSSRAVCAYVHDHRKLWSALLTGGAAGVMREAFLREAKRIPVPAGRPETWLPADLGIIHGTTSTIEVLAWWLSDGGHLGIDQIADILDRLVIAPTITPGDPPGGRTLDRRARG